MACAAAKTEYAAAFARFRQYQEIADGQPLQFLMAITKLFFVFVDYALKPRPEPVNPLELSVACVSN